MILITFHLAELYDVNAQIMITAVAGLFILPFFLFSSLAGQIADKYEKSFLIRIIKFVEIVLMCLTAAAFETMARLFALLHGDAVHLLRPAQVQHPAAAS